MTDIVVPYSEYGYSFICLKLPQADIGTYVGRHILHFASEGTNAGESPITATGVDSAMSCLYLLLAGRCS